jgi:hypothetical protein
MLLLQAKAATIKPTVAIPFQCIASSKAKITVTNGCSVLAFQSAEKVSQSSPACNIPACWNDIYYSGTITPLEMPAAHSREFRE